MWKDCDELWILNNGMVFKGGDWKQEINVRDFIQNNYTPYDGDSNFLEKTTEKTDKLWNEVLELYKKKNMKVKAEF